MAYTTKAEHALARTRRQLQLAQEGLASARRLGEPTLIKAFEGHVLRMLSYAANAQDRVIRERAHRALPITMPAPYTLDFA